jgi:uncharacterized sulfatase
MRTATISIVLSAVVPLVACAQPSEPSEATLRLLERNKMFEPQVFQVADNVYTALGYQVSANSMIIGDDGVIIVDPGQQIPGGRQVLEAFREITDLPVRGIIYTHGHADHTTAAPVFYSEDQGIQVWARSNYPSEAITLRERGYQGGVRASNMQGFDLPPEQKIGVGIAIPPERPVAGGITVGTDAPPPPPPVEPTHTFETERVSIEIAGVELELVAAPGETADQLYVWLPEQRVVFAGDNFYQSWPNVYPLRGTAQRSVRNWITSIDKMIQEDPLHVVGGHTAPIFDDAVEVLTNYRDAMQWVVDRTVEGTKAYLTPDELVEYAALPERFAGLDYLAPYYGSIEGTIRTIYAQEIGWFDGDPLTLHRESPAQQSRRIADLAGGVDELMAHARNAMADDDPLGAAQFAQHVTRLEPDNGEAWLLMADALAVVGERTFNAPSRNYTLSSSNRFRRRAAELGVE